MGMALTGILSTMDIGFNMGMGSTMGLEKQMGTYV